MEQPNLTPGEDAGCWLGRTWAASLARAFDSLAGESTLLEWSPETGGADPGAAAGQFLWWEQGFDLTPEPGLWVGTPEETWRELASCVLRALGADEIQPEEATSTWMEILNQSFSALGQAMGERLKRAVAAGQGRNLEGPPSGVRFGAVRFSGARAALAPILVAFGERLADAIQEPDRESALAVAARGTAGQDGWSAPNQDRQPRASRTLDLLREVELPVCVSFGRARMPLQDVLKLTAGSVVELDRSIDEPVELVVNDTVVALGEVVVIEGNYGLRIQRIMGRDKLLRPASTGGTVMT